jgi:tetratricopeptide (TPR) repeat protein
MKKLFSHLLWIIVFCFPVPVFSQDATVVDTLKKKLGEVHTTADRFYILESLSRVMMNVNLQEAEKYGSELIRMAEESRDRKLMVRAYLSNGLRCSYFRGQKSFITRSIDYYEKALEIARKNKLEEEIGGAQLRLAIIYLALPDRDKALSYANQAFSLISTLDNDSLRSEGHTVYGQVYQARNDKTLALRNYQPQKYPSA